MDKKTYIEKLIVEIEKQGMSINYASKCTRYATRLLDDNLPVIFDIEHFALLIGISLPDLTKMIFGDEKFYSQLRIPKKCSGFREIDSPSMDLKYIQRWILKNILNKIHISEFAVGFCENKSILDNAKRHLNQHCIVNLDIKDFFPSISF